MRFLGVALAALVPTVSHGQALPVCDDRLLLSRCLRSYPLEYCSGFCQGWEYNESSCGAHGTTGIQLIALEKENKGLKEQYLALRAAQPVSVAGKQPQVISK